VTWSDFRDRHKDETMYVIGGGTSLRDFRWSLIMDRLTMGCNEHVLHMPFIPNYYYQMDWNKSIDWFFEAVKHFPLIRFVDPQCHEDKDYISVPRLPQDDETLFSEKGIGYATFSIICMVEIAVYMGCAPIILLGVDLYEDGEYEYFWRRHCYLYHTKEHLITMKKRLVQQFKRFRELGDRVRVGNKDSLLVTKRILKYQEVT